VKVVLDTNVIVAAVATRGACAELFARVLAVHTYAIDGNLLDEVDRVLREKFRLPPERVEAVLDLLRATAVVLQPQPLDQAVRRDPDDDRILALARAFQASVLVTGDDDLLVLHPWEALSIVRPRDFWLLDRADLG